LREITEFLHSFGLRPFSLTPLKGDGSKRSFLRVETGGQSLVLILPQPGGFGLREARAYVHIGRFLRQKGLPVPRIYAYDEKRGFILVEDLGDTRLQDLAPERREPFYRQALEILARLSRLGETFPEEVTLEGRYDASLMWEKEASYFLREFLAPRLKDQAKVKEAESILHALWKKAAGFARPQGVLHRDFQSRNLMLKGGKLYVIDFQAARLGPSAYDLASLLIDPYAGLTDREKTTLRKEFEAQVPLLSGEFEAFCLFRNFQILGAFAKLTREGKRWFEAYIPRALASLRKHLGWFPPEGEALLKLLP